jgi:hypothetical protein
MRRTIRRSHDQFIYRWGLAVNVPLGPSSLIGRSPELSIASHNARGDNVARGCAVTAMVFALTFAAVDSTPGIYFSRN